MPAVTPPPPLPSLSLLRSFLGIIIPLSILLGIVVTGHYYLSSTSATFKREAGEQLNVSLARRVIESDISGIIGDLMFLAEHIEAQKLFALPGRERREIIAQEFQVFAANKQIYDQVRFIDDDGGEVVRVNYNGGQPRIVPVRELQDKSERYYFRETISLGRNEVYMSPLDLNVESGQIERPFKPVLRVGTPVFDRNGIKRGIVLLNYFGRNLIEHFRQAVAGIVDHISLIDNNGYWLASPAPEDEWGFMLSNGRTLGRRHPAVWSQIRGQEAGQFTDRAGLFTFTTVYPLNTALRTANIHNTPHDKTDLQTREYFWKVVGHISQPALADARNAFFYNNSLLYSSMMVLLTIGSLLAAQARVRHRWSDARREYEQMFRHTLENVQLASVSINTIGQVQFCNEFFLNLTGWDKDQVIGLDWFNTFIPKPERMAIRETLLPENGVENAPVSIECHIQPRIGDLRLIAWTTTASVDPDGGAVAGLTLIGKDVTEERLTQAQLAKLSQVVEQSPSIVMITNREGLIEYVNPKFEEVTGYPSTEVLGRNPRILTSGELKREEYEELWRTIRDGREWRGELHNRKKDGTLYWEYALMSPIRDAQGKITHFLAVKEDITERKRLEEEIEARNLELAKAQTLAAMGRMASMIAHDLRNPLSSIKMGLKLFGKNPQDNLSADSQELQKIGLEQIHYMENILSDLLSYSKPDALSPEWISPDKLLDMAVGLAQRSIDDNRIIVQTRFQSGLPTLYADTTKLRQVFVNLICNAAQAIDDQNGESPRVIVDAQLDLTAEGPRIRVTVCDNGTGIDPEDEEKIFEPFFTTHTSGTGLGLPIVKRILEQHGGSIRLYQNEPCGTCAEVMLPTRPASLDGQGEIQPLLVTNGVES